MSRGPQVVVGLGNPGPTYRETRHNIGHAVVERLAARLGGRFRAHGTAAVALAEWNAERLFVAKPVGFMNAVGPLVARLLDEFGLDPAALVVVYDDLDLPFGHVRIRHRGRHGGHNGVRSLIETLGTEALRRVKIGIGRPETRDEVVDWVLTEFSPAERDALPGVIERGTEAVLELLAAPPAVPPEPASPP